MPAPELGTKTGIGGRTCPASWAAGVPLLGRPGLGSVCPTGRGLQIRVGTGVALGRGMDRTVALAVELETPSSNGSHLRLAASAADAADGGDGPTRVFESGLHPLPSSSSQGPLCHGGGTASITTTITAIDAEPAPGIVAEQAPSPMDELLDIDESDVREVLEGRLELEPSRPGARAPQ